MLITFRSVRRVAVKLLPWRYAADMAQWEEQWKRKLEADRKLKERENLIRSIEESIEVANKLTLEAEKVQNLLDTILIDNLDPRVLDYESLKDHRMFNQTLPVKPKREEKCTKQSREDAEYNKKLSFLKRLSRKQVEKQKIQSDSQFKKDYNLWEDQEKRKDLKYDQAFADYEIVYNEWYEQKKNILF